MRCLMLLANLTKDVVVLTLSSRWGRRMEVGCFRLAEVPRVSYRGLGLRGLGYVLRLLGGILGGIEMSGKTVVGILVSRSMVLSQGCLLLVLGEGCMDGGGLRLLLRESRGAGSYWLADRG